MTRLIEKMDLRRGKNLSDNELPKKTEPFRLSLSLKIGGDNSKYVSVGMNGIGEKISIGARPSRALLDQSQVGDIQVPLAGGGVVVEDKKDLRQSGGGGKGRGRKVQVPGQRLLLARQKRGRGGTDLQVISPV